MIDILFIQPPLVDYDKKIKPFALVNLTTCPPIGIAYLLSYLEKFDFTTAVIDMDIEKFGISKVPAIIEKFKPKVIGIGIIGDMVYPISTKVIKKIKETKNIPIIVGGVFPTNNSDFLLEKFFIDYLVRGEGEQTLLELLNYILFNKGKLNEINGLSYKHNDSIIHNPPRELIRNLDEIPFPAWHKFKVDKYFMSTSIKNPSFAIRASRGCPYRCLYCCSSVFEYYRIRSPKNVVDEIELLINNFKIKDLSFHDDVFNLNNNWIVSFCKELINRKIKIKWRCICRVDRIDEKIISLMKQTGCYSITLGIESSKDKFLNFLQKDFSIKQVKDAIKIIKKYKIEIVSYFMLGIPGQTIADLKHNIKFIKKLKTDFVSILILNPLTGTELYKLAEKKDWLIKSMIDSSDSPELFLIQKQWWKIPNLNEEILNYYIKQSYFTFYFSLGTFIKFIAKFIRNPMRFLYLIRNLIQRFSLKDLTV